VVDDNYLGRSDKIVDAGHHGLLINDAMVLAVALRLKADVLVSSDKAFHNLDEPDVHFPTDLRL
jgi:predicted nucleic acid-binding protein